MQPQDLYLKLHDILKHWIETHNLYGVEVEKLIKAKEPSSVEWEKHFVDLYFLVGKQKSEEDFDKALKQALILNFSYEGFLSLLKQNE